MPFDLVQQILITVSYCVLTTFAVCYILIFIQELAYCLKSDLLPWNWYHRSSRTICSLCLRHTLVVFWFTRCFVDCLLNANLFVIRNPSFIINYYKKNKLKINKIFHSLFEQSQESSPILSFKLLIKSAITILMKLSHYLLINYLIFNFWSIITPI